MKSKGYGGVRERNASGQRGPTDTHVVGNANELNAAYAADGYARIKGCPGVREF